MEQSISACWLVDWGGQFIAQRLSQTPRYFGPGLCSRHFHHLFCFFFLNPLLFEVEHLNGIVRKRETEARTFLSVAVFVPWLATPTLMASLHPRAEQDSWTRPHQLPLLPASQIWYRHGALHCMNSNSATFNWPTIETGAWQMDRSPTTSHSTGRLCITPVVVFIVVPLLWW